MPQNKSFKVLIIADPLSKVKKQGDTSLAFCEGALKSGDLVYWCDAEDVVFWNNAPVVRRSERMLKASVDTIESQQHSDPIPLAEFDFAMVRKDPPFNDVYRDLCWFLSSQSKTIVINDASALLTFHEKAVQWRAAAEGAISVDNLVPTCVSKRRDDLTAFAQDLQNRKQAQHGFVLKPWLGHGGEDVHLCESFAQMLDTLKTAQLHPTDSWMLQPFLPEIKTAGDRRVLIAKGKVVGSFVRIPQDGKIESNLARGGRAESRPMTFEQTTLMSNLARFLLEKNILFAGVDLIANRIGEVNITSPTGIRTIEQLDGRAYAQDIYSQLVGRA